MAVPITVYRREHCSLCEEALATIESVAEETGVAVDIEEVDVDADEALREKYGDHVPVVAVDGVEQFRIRVDPTVLVGLLREA
ncbi:glutaredoxin family protein [Halapricum sp. CBA1109]|uniref:glutaredoxin family protein n=1 Tax=Halapricum sp. CBA1109 TaxID=2668068 RepID=UPI0012FB1C18|nr:glutaredoxin family protein [Halapricum sp. CBA1109]MUV91090.1 glutaredoxin family protein [Halapricum sp. CBA1109]